MNLGISHVGEWALKESKQHIKNIIKEVLLNTVEVINFEIFSTANEEEGKWSKMVAEELMVNGLYKWFSSDDQYNCELVFTLDPNNQVILEFREIQPNQDRYIILSEMTLKEFFTSKSTISNFIIDAFDQYMEAQSDPDRFLVPDHIPDFNDVRKYDLEKGKPIE